MSPERGPEHGEHRLAPPLIITSRLMAGMRIEGAGTLSVEAYAFDDEDRVVYRYFIDGPDGHEIGNGDDLRSGVGYDVNYPETVTALLSFLDACAESRRFGGGENADLFSEAVGEWALQHHEEIAMARWELEGNE